MFRSSSRAASTLVLLVVLVGASRAGDPEDLYISVPASGAIYRLDSQSGALEPFASGLTAPFYGTWDEDGFLYMPDRVLGAIFRISESGVVTPFTAGGWLTAPVAIVRAPGGGFVATDIFQETVVRIDASGQQTLLADATSSGGLLSGPGGLAYGPDGLLYVANNLSNTIVSVDDRSGRVALVSDGGGLLDQPGGLAVDNAGNLFVANYGTSTIVRVRLSDGEAELFNGEPTMQRPNDVRLARQGGLHVTMKNSTLALIDPAGQFHVVVQEPMLGALDGVASQSYLQPCDGSFLPHGEGLEGSGGHVPRLAGLFAPCPGRAVAIEADRLLGGTTGSLAWGLAPSALPFKQGTLLVDLGPPGGLIPLAFPGVGHGQGSTRLAFTLPDAPGLVGLSVYLQVIAVDPGAPAGLSFSNGLEERIGS
jgi:hypothetical protein